MQHHQHVFLVNATCAFCMLGVHFCCCFICLAIPGNHTAMDAIACECRKLRNHFIALTYEEGSCCRRNLCNVHLIFYDFPMTALPAVTQPMRRLVFCTYFLGMFCTRGALPSTCFQIHQTMYRQSPRQNTVSCSGQNAPMVVEKAFKNKCRGISCLLHPIARFVRPQCGSLHAWDKKPRIGEAKNPGPPCNTKYIPDFVNATDCSLNIGVINPTGLIYKHDAVATLGPGIWSIAESRATQKGQQTLRREFKKLQFNCEFSNPVPTLGNNRGNYYQGIASGVACITHLPMVKTLFDIPSSIIQSSRFLATHVPLGPHATLLVITIYAPPPTSHSMQNPQAITDALLQCANRIVRSWHGPAIIQGDFNQDVSANADIAELFNVGWVDAHDISVQVHQHPKKPTCITSNGGTSHNTKIFCNPIVANSIVYCNAWDDFLFAAHPTLVLTCNLNTISRPHADWKLPKAFTCKSFDREVAEAFQPNPNFSQKFRDAIQKCDVQQAAQLWTNQAEEVLATSARDSEGKCVHFPPSHFGRNKGPKIINSPLSAPILRPARQSEPNPTAAQGPTRYRQHLKQYRRIHTLVGLYRAFQKQNTPQNLHACHELWKAIRDATGFGKHGFPKWVCETFSILFSYAFPSLEYVVHLRDLFGEHFHSFTQKVNLDHRNQRDNVYQQDWENGGALTFAALRESGPQPSCYVGKTSQTMVKRVKWTKTGLTLLPCVNMQSFRAGCPVSFQGQSAMVTNVNMEFNTITVDRPLMLRSQNYSISQKNLYF